jgi:hypothetical protein
MVREQPSEPSRRLLLERWASKSDEPEYAGDVHGPYSRAAWLPVIGPTAWLIWGSVAGRVRDHARAECTLEEVGRPWAFADEDVSWGLLQLARFGLAMRGGDDRWHVRTVCPPLCDRLVAGASPSVQAMHQRRLRPPGWGSPRSPRRDSASPAVAMGGRLGWQLHP